MLIYSECLININYLASAQLYVNSHINKIMKMTQTFIWMYFIS